MWQSAKRHDNCLKVLLGLESISYQEINKQKLPEVHEHAGFKEVTLAAEFYSTSSMG